MVMGMWLPWVTAVSPTRALPRVSSINNTLIRIYKKNIGVVREREGGGVDWVRAEALRLSMCVWVEVVGFPPGRPTRIPAVRPFSVRTVTEGRWFGVVGARIHGGGGV